MIYLQHVRTNFKYYSQISLRQDGVSLQNNCEELPNCSLIATPVYGFFLSRYVYNPRNVTTKLMRPKQCTNFY